MAEPPQEALAELSAIPTTGPKRWKHYVRHAAVEGLGGVWKAVVFLGGWGVAVVTVAVAVWVWHASAAYIVAAVFIGLFVIAAVGGYRMWSSVETSLSRAVQERDEARQEAEQARTLAARPERHAIARAEDQATITFDEARVAPTTQLISAADSAVGHIGRLVTHESAQPQALVRVEGQSYNGQRVPVSGRQYVRCDFTDVEFLFDSREPFGFDDCEYHGMRRAVFAEPTLAMTLQFLAQTELIFVAPDHGLLPPGGQGR